MTQRRILNFAAEPREDVFRSLLRSALDAASLAGLVVRSARVKLSPQAELLLRNLESFHVESEEVAAWPGTELVGGRRSTRRLYRLDEGSAALLGNAAQGLFDWVNPYLPEDLHLLRDDGTVFLGTIAQEEDGWLELSDDEFRHFSEVAPDVIALLRD